MKTLKNLFFTAFILCLFINVSFSQQMYHVHEDVLKPSHVKEYESILAELMSMLNKNEIKDSKWLSFVTDNSHYLYLRAIENYADLDKPNFISQLIEKEGKEKIIALFNRMDKCYDTELDYIISLNSSLSYMPNGINQTPEGENYRKNHFFYVSPGQRDVVLEKMKAIKAYFESKKSKLYYRIYNSGFGTDGEFYMVAIAAKDAADLEMKNKENETLIGEEGRNLINDMYFNTLKYETKELMFRPDISFSSK
ncbi:hypothetical protein [Confluentibacter flavum]|uniref:Uncharacterized protein n=1 Tax=Confluentibacter flavum TaxID=1909700 RepID=A0A2N3HI87_9FLAO|nr:hypothetical protein [Confluentibacter flavum]PKQ44613.1 hypothetical protein CSW08_12315 [Confluentibacter flavum]